MNFTFFSSTHGTFSRIDHILGHKSSLGKFKKTETIPSIFSDHNAVRLDLSYGEKLLKIPTYGGWTTRCWITNKSQKKSKNKICIETNENENTTTQNLWDTVKVVQRGKFIAIQAYLKKQEKKSNKYPNSTPKATRKGRNEEPQG